MKRFIFLLLFVFLGIEIYTVFDTSVGVEKTVFFMLFVYL